jgi:hypothetical protein
MKFQVRSYKNAEFDVKYFRIADARTRNLVAKAVVLVGLALLIGGAAYAMISRDDAAVRWIVGTGTTLVGAVLGYYFAKSK